MCIQIHKHTQTHTLNTHSVRRDVTLKIAFKESVVRMRKTWSILKDKFWRGEKHWIVIFLPYRKGDGIFEFTRKITSHYVFIKSEGFRPCRVTVQKGRWIFNFINDRSPKRKCDSSTITELFGGLAEIRTQVFLVYHPVFLFSICYLYFCLMWILWEGGK